MSSIDPNLATILLYQQEGALVVVKIQSKVFNWGLVPDDATDVRLRAMTKAELAQVLLGDGVVLKEESSLGPTGA